jgi:hypothetical protein
MKFFILLFICFVYLNCQGQQTNVYSPEESLQLKLANSYLESELGEKFLKDSLIFIGIYQSVLNMYAFEIKPSLCRNKNKNMIIVFFDGVNIETKFNTKICRKDINNYFKGLKYNNIFYNKKYVLSLAKNKLKKGIKEWQIELDGVANSINWVIKSYNKEELKPIYRAGGQCFEINIRTGKYRILDWTEIE